MTRDYRRAHGYRPRATLPGWLWFISGIAVGLLIAFLVYLKRHDLTGGEGDPVARVEAPGKIDIPAPQTGVTPPRFDFYTILPEREIVVPDPDTKEQVTIKEAKEIREPAEIKPEKTVKPNANVAAAPKAATAKPGTPAARKGNYVLQVGSFKRMDEADRLKAALALIGIESSIQIVQLNEGDNWHRVRVGPFLDMARVTETRVKLKQNKFNSLLLQVKSE